MWSRLRRRLADANADDLTDTRYSMYLPLDNMGLSNQLLRQCRSFLLYFLRSQPILLYWRVRMMRLTESSVVQGGQHLLTGTICRMSAR